MPPRKTTATGSAPRKAAARPTSPAPDDPSAPSASDASPVDERRDDAYPEVDDVDVDFLGSLVEHVYFDPYRGAGGEDVARLGLVVAVDEADGADDEGVVQKLARVVWFDDVSDPIPLAQLRRR